MGLQDGGGILVFIAAFFVVPQIMQYMPDFDPLLAIVGLFVVLGVLQHLGVISANAGQAGEFGQDGRRGNRTGRARGGAEASQEESRPPNLPELLSEAERCVKQNSYARAQELASKATDLDPENAQAWELLATAQKWDGKREDALATVKKAQEIYEVHSEGLTALARELEQAESPGDIAAECEAKGEEFLGKRMYDLACECYTKAIDALEAGGQVEDSDKELRLRLRRRRADCAQQLQDWGVCRRDATVLLEANPNDPTALLQRAAANEALEKFSAALEDARKLRSIDPKSTVANRIIHNCQQALRS